MSKISELIFNGKEYYITSRFGKRSVITTSAGSTSTQHNGSDYGTNGVKLAQYAIESGYVFSAAKASDGANYVWVIYPRIKLAFLHYHLDSYAVKTGQKVKKGTLLGYTGKSGKATGIHLHLGVRDLSKLTTAQINAMTWDRLRACPYIDPEKIDYKEPSTNPYKKPNYIVNRRKYEYGKIKVGNEGVKWVQYQLQAHGFYSDRIDGFFGPKTEQSVKNFQKVTTDINGKKLVADGSVGPLTRGALDR